MMIGGVGVLRGLSGRLVNVENRIEDVDQRVTTEVKKRASQAGVEARQKLSESEVKALAMNTLAQGNGSPAARTGLGKPSIVNRGRARR